ncbi:hypothetical protein [Nocardia alni]|uniref:hypothetical protein n=1 Tax=Nocardia alni TaxID=2815723 RepID=UPI0020B375F4|nr:hypothetical protein [Nocardia alni]
MTFRRGSAAAAVVIGAMTVALGTAHADPAPARPQVDYTTRVADKTVITRLAGGTFQLVDKPGANPQDKRQVVDVKDRAGNIAMEMPLDFRISGVRIPVTPVLRENGRELDLTPTRPAGVDLSKPVAPRLVDATVGGKPLRAQPIASPVENQRAFRDFATKAGLAFAVGGAIGTLIGAAIGCVVAIFILCVPGLIVGAIGGGVLGTMAAGGPSLTSSAIDLGNTVRAPNGTTQWAGPDSAR